MLESAIQAFGETFSPPLRKILLKSLGLAFLLLIVLGMVLQGAITHLVSCPIRSTRRSRSSRRSV